MCPRWTPGRQWPAPSTTPITQTLPLTTRKNMPAPRNGSSKPVRQLCGPGAEELGANVTEVLGEERPMKH